MKRIDGESETFIPVAVNLRGREGGAMPEMADVASLRAADGGSSRSYVAYGISNQPTPKFAVDLSPSLDAKASGGGRVEAVITPQMAVRRLLPVECERLQGFQDNFTAIPYRGKIAADGPRYKALGNSMSVPVLSWILDRCKD